MMLALTLRAAKSTAIASAVALALVAGLLAAPASAAPIPAEPDCPDVLPTSSVTAGMTGQGLTVVRGATPQPFAVEVLGVLENGIGAGRDMIIIEASDLPGRQVISAGGGIWAGMSGSPVYIDGKLLGAVAWGFSAAPSPIGGVTPAADMLDLLDLPNPAARTRAATPAAAKEVSLSATERRAIAAETKAVVPAGSLDRLPLPMSVSGLTSNRLQRFQAEAEEDDLPVVAYAGGRRNAPAATEAPTRPKAGGNFLAALSYGDVTAAAIGTTTAICDDQAVAFGHPFQFIGAASYGANDANSLAIVRDNTFGSFKLVNVGAQFGTVDQDRQAGLRADLTRVPALTPIRSTIRNLDTDRRRRGETLAADQTSLPLLTAFGLVANYDVVFDEFLGDGRASTNWTITGRRAGNVPFTINRSNTFASQFDIAGDAAFDAADAVNALVTNEFEPVSIDRVSFLSSVTTAYQQWTITSMAVSVNGGSFVSPELLGVAPGDTLRVRVRMRPYRSTAVKTSLFTLTVPANTAGRAGSLVVTGGVDLGSGAYEPGTSLNALLRNMSSTPRNDEVVASLTLDPVNGGTRPLVRAARNRHSQTVTGERSIALEVN